MIREPERGLPAYGKLPCEADPERWFADATTMEGKMRVKSALDACVGCPALLACREHAKKVKPSCGVWGGRYYGQHRRTNRNVSA